MLTREYAAVYTILGILAFAISYLGILAMLKWTKQDRLIDIPNARSSHFKPTPSGGGVWIVIVTIGALLPLILFTGVFRNALLVRYVGGALLLATVSLADDVFDLSYRLRFAIQVVAAAIIVIGSSVSRLSVPFGGELSLGWLGIPFTLIFIVGLTNAYNFMDGIDGMAGLQGVIAGLYFFALALIVNQDMLAVPSLLIAASTLGFLVHNWAPAQIFMGDVGSTFLGYSLASLIVVLSSQDSQFFLLGCLALWPFIADTSYTLLRRLLHKERIFEAHRSHFYQRLTDRGYSHASVTLFYGLLSLLGILSGLFWYFEFPF